MSDDFKTTRWSMVLAAGKDRRSAREALEWLCGVYWYPLYAFARRRGYDAENARDLIQSYFLELLEKNVLSQADPNVGRFRAYLLATLKNFAANQREHERALKRRLQDSTYRVSLDDAEQRYLGDLADPADPAKLFEKRWALTVVERAFQRLEQEHLETGKAEVFRLLHGFVSGDSEVPYKAVGERLSMSEGAVKVAVHRMRTRLGVLLREEVAETVADPQNIDSELKYLLGIIASS